jgi:murein DD-endopeptidase MepM/ murein hydrolase activator NlpD
MAVMRVAIPPQFATSVNNFAAQMNNLLAATTQLNAQMAAAQRPATPTVFPTFRQTFTHNLTSRFQQMNQLFVRFERTIRYSVDRMLWTFGPHVRSFVRTVRPIANLLNVTGFLRSIRPVMTFGRYIALGSAAGYAGMAITGAGSAIALIIGTLKWLASTFYDAFYKDLLQARAIGASVGGLRAFRIGFNELPEDPMFLESIFRIHNDFASNQAAIFQLFKVKKSADMAETMVNLLVALQQHMLTNTTSGLQLPPGSPLLKLASPQFLLSLRQMSPERLQLLVRRFYATRPGLQATPESMEAWLEVSRKWGALTDGAANQFINILTELNVVWVLTETARILTKATDKITEGLVGKPKPLDPTDWSSWITADTTLTIKKTIKSVKLKLTELNLELKKLITYLGKQIDRLKNYLRNANISIVTSAKAEGLPFSPGPRFRPGVGPGQRDSRDTRYTRPTGPTFRPGIRPSGPSFRPGVGPRSTVPSGPSEPSRPTGPTFRPGKTPGTRQAPGQPGEPLPLEPTPSARPGRGAREAAPTEYDFAATQEATGLPRGVIDAVRSQIQQQESSFQYSMNNQRGKMRYSYHENFGAYQYNEEDVANAARYFGEQPPTRQQLLASPKLQEKYMEGYWLSRMKSTGLDKDPVFIDLRNRAKNGDKAAQDRMARMLISQQTSHGREAVRGLPWAGDPTQNYTYWLRGFNERLAKARRDGTPTAPGGGPVWPGDPVPTAPVTSAVPRGPAEQRSSGGLVSPIPGVDNFGIGSSNVYGASRSGGGRAHSGNDLHAPNGSPVVSMNGGTVLYTGYDPGGYDHYIVIKGDDNVVRRYAAHAAVEQLAPGSRVQQGQRIGTVGLGHVHYEEIPETINGRPNPVYQEFIAGGHPSTSHQRGTVDPSGPAGTLRRIGRDFQPPATPGVPGTPGSTAIPGQPPVWPGDPVPTHIRNQLGVSPNQLDRPYHTQGDVTIDGQTFQWASGGGQRGSIPYGTFPLHIGEGDIGPVGQRIGSVATVGAPGGVIPDPKFPGNPRVGIQIHPWSARSLDELYTAGCFGIPSAQWPAFRAALLAKAKTGSLVLSIQPNGRASIMTKNEFDIQNNPPASSNVGPSTAPASSPWPENAPVQTPGTKPSATTKPWPGEQGESDHSGDSDEAEDHKIKVKNHGSPNGVQEEDHHGGGSLNKGATIDNRSDHDVNIEPDSSVIVPEEHSRPDIIRRPGAARIPRNQKTIEAKPAPLRDDATPEERQKAAVHAIGQTETGFSQKEAYREEYNSPVPIKLPSGKIIAANANVKKEGERAADYGYYQMNQNDVEEGIKLGMDPNTAKHLNGGGKGGASTLEEQTGAVTEYTKLKYSSLFSKVGAGNFEAFRVSAKQGGAGTKWFGLTRDRGEPARKAYGAELKRLKSQREDMHYISPEQQPPAEQYAEESVE